MEQRDVFGEAEEPPQTPGSRRPALEVGDRVPSHNPFCFGCGRDHPCGLRMDMRVAAPDTVTSSFVVREEHQGGPGLIHGGVLAAAFDEILGSVNWLLRSPAVTGNLSTSFRRPIPVDETVSMRAWVDHVEGRKVYLKGEARLGDGTLAAEADGTFIRVPLSHFAKHGRPEDVAAARAEMVERWTE